MLETIQKYYSEYKMYVNIAIGVIALYVVYRLTKKK